MVIYLRDRSDSMTRAWNLYFYSNPGVEVSCGDIFDDGPQWLIQTNLLK
jgi:hypothetical protein